MLKLKNQMSKIIKYFFVICSLIIFSNIQVFAQVSTATPSPTLTTSTTSEEDVFIKTLKDKLATKVAELRESNIKAVSGVVTEVKTPKKITGLKIKNWKDEVYDIKIDSDLTKFFQISSGVKKEVKVSEIEQDSYIIVTGIIKDKTIDANFVYIDEQFIVGSGTVTEANKEDFFISVISTDKINYTLDIEKNTKQQLLNIKTLVPENVGFSKIKVGDSIHFVVKKTGTEKEANRYSAQKVLIIPQEYFSK